MVLFLWHFFCWNFFGFLFLMRPVRFGLNGDRRCHICFVDGDNLLLFPRGGIGPIQWIWICHVRRSLLPWTWSFYLCDRTAALELQFRMGILQKHETGHLKFGCHQENDLRSPTALSFRSKILMNSDIIIQTAPSPWCNRIRSSKSLQIPFL